MKQTKCKPQTFDGNRFFFHFDALLHNGCEEFSRIQVVLGIIKQRQVVKGTEGIVFSLQLHDKLFLGLPEHPMQRGAFHVDPY